MEDHNFLAFILDHETFHDQVLEIVWGSLLLIYRSTRPAYPIRGSQQNFKHLTRNFYIWMFLFESCKILSPSCKIDFIGIANLFSNVVFLKQK